ncbi:hypothetical protein BXZ70DRAFT_70141 [Cristinia sonorae]|uniref:Uncharacterized protein n=1 Tax=Cristinia sonorae TaxID=1940300 RepID=A0A8K0USK8_9AGAR|nr:hypothetical protein BXZ70DRAFT_70141 [Cristinia sonorae]
MAGCRELARLPKAKALRSLNFKRTTPGSIVASLFATSNRRKVLDPTHIAASIPPIQRKAVFPNYKTHAFTLRLLPQALLAEPEFRFPDPPFHYVTRSQSPHRLNMSLAREIASDVHHSPFVRSKMTTKLKSAISLVVTRGANVRSEGDGKPMIFFDEQDVGEKWLLQNWTYSVRLALPMLRISYVELIPLLRDALNNVKARGDAIEAAWAAGHPLPDDARCIANRRHRSGASKRHKQS